MPSESIAAQSKLHRTRDAIIERSIRSGIGAAVPRTTPIGSRADRDDEGKAPTHFRGADSSHTTHPCKALKESPGAYARLARLASNQPKSTMTTPRSDFFLLRRLGPSTAFERKLQPGLLGLVLALFFLSLSNLLDDERR